MTKIKPTALLFQDIAKLEAEKAILIHWYVMSLDDCEGRTEYEDKKEWVVKKLEETK